MADKPKPVQPPLFQSGAITIKDDDNIKKPLSGCHAITKEDFQTQIVAYDKKNDGEKSKKF